jgi:hypothetical protein
MAHDPTIPRLEAELKAAIKVALAAQNKLSAARDRADLPDRQSVYTADEVSEIYKANHAELLAIIPSIWDSARGIRGPYTHLAEAFAGARRMEAADPVGYRNRMASFEVHVLAHQIVEAAERGEKPSQKDLDAFTRASAIAAGKVVEMPSGDLAQQIIAAGRKRRGET